MLLLCAACILRSCAVPVQPETVAAYLVPRVRTVVARKSLSTYIKYLTIPRALVKFMSAPTKANKYFNKHGKWLCYACWARRLLLTSATDRLHAYTKLLHVLT